MLKDRCLMATVLQGCPLYRSIVFAAKATYLGLGSSCYLSSHHVADCPGPPARTQFPQPGGGFDCTYSKTPLLMVSWHSFHDFQHVLASIRHDWRASARLAGRPLCTSCLSFRFRFSYALEYRTLRVSCQLPDQPSGLWFLMPCS